MSEHPAPEVLDAWLRVELPAEEGKAVLRHLVEGCRQCSDAVHDLWPFALPATPASLRPEQLDAYDFPVVRAGREVLRQLDLAARERQQALGDLAALVERGALPQRSEPLDLAGPAGWTWCEQLLADCREQVLNDPQAAAERASVALNLAEVRLDETRFPPGRLVDLRASAWAELANARRAADDLVGAEAGLTTAAELALAGSGDYRLQIRILDLSVSLFRAQRQLDEAERCLTRLLSLCRKHNEIHLTGRALISKALLLGVRQNYRAAIKLIDQGYRMIDREREPQLAFRAVQSMIDFLTKAEDFAAAKRLLGVSLPLYDKHGGTLDFLRLRWVEGMIAAGTGKPSEAEGAFREARMGFAQASRPYYAALVTLDLAGLYLRQGRLAEVRRLASEMLAAFQALGIRREAIAAVLLLDEAARTERLTVALLRQIAREFQRLEGSFQRSTDPKPDSFDRSGPRRL